VTQSCVSKWEDATTIPGNISCVPDARVKIAADHHPVILQRLEQVAAGCQTHKKRVSTDTQTIIFRWFSWYVEGVG
jgi:hypothetical protein